jgi:hypothetical protein
MVSSLSLMSAAAVYAATSQQPQCVPENSTKVQRDGSAKSGAPRD